MPSKNRVSITVSKEELERWEAANNRESLSAFIRDAVNEYVKIQEPKKQNTLFDLFLEQRAQFKTIQEKLERLESIEGDIIDLSAAMAKFDFIVPVERNGEWVWDIKKKE